MKFQEPLPVLSVSLSLSLSLPSPSSLPLPLPSPSTPLSLSVCMHVYYIYPYIPCHTYTYMIFPSKILQYFKEKEIKLSINKNIYRAGTKPVLSKVNKFHWILSINCQLKKISVLAESGGVMTSYPYRVHSLCAIHEAES